MVHRRRRNPVSISSALSIDTEDDDFEDGRISLEKDGSIPILEELADEEILDIPYIVDGSGKREEDHNTRNQTKNT